jgi:ABC-type glycerol-3-phosphate transport system substrate-binding protein
MNRLKGIGLTLAAALIAAAVQAQDASISGDITVWTWPSNDIAMNDLLPEFNKAYPNIKVDVQAFGAANNVYLDKVQRAFIGGSGPDVAMIEIGMMALLRGRPGWEDLSKAPYNAGDMMADFAPFTVKNVTLPTGEIVALPKHTGPGGMFYRTDIFKEAGLPTDPTEVAALMSDWDAFLEQGKKVVKPNERWLFGNGEDIVRAIMAQNGVSYFDAEGKLQFDNPVYLEAMEKVKQAADAGLISPFAAWSPEWQAAFAKGQFATVLYGNWMGGFLKRSYSVNESGKWAVALAPGDNGNRSYNSGGDYIGILKTSKYKDAAWAFIKWYVTSDVSLKAQYLSNDLYPAYLPAAKADWINTPDPYYSGQNVNEVFSKVQAEMIPFVLNDLDPVAYTATQTAINNIARGQMSAADAISAAKKEVEAKM